jgi:hypothetical protein
MELRTGLMQDKSVTTIPARVFDPMHRARWIVAACATSVTAGIALLAVSPIVGFALMMLGVATALSWDLRFRRRARDRMLVCKPGSIHTPGSGLIRARDLEGATTARVGERVALVLAHRRRRRQPLILELADEASLDTICKSLGIGHHGFGYIDFVTEPARTESWSRVLGAIGVVSVLSMLAEPLIGFGALFLSLTAIVILAFVRLALPPPFARITSTGVFLPSGMFVPFRSIEHVELLADVMIFRVRTERGAPELRVPVRAVVRARHGMTRRELEHMAEQLRAASDRAHGQFKLKSVPEGLAVRLARGAAENDADWHARLDTLTLGAGYRALSAEPAELWALLEDPEAPTDVRAAAARVLRRIDKDTLRVRVKDVLATERDEATRARIADSIEEDDEPAPDSQSAAHS